MPSPPRVLHALLLLYLVCPGELESIHRINVGALSPHHNASHNRLPVPLRGQEHGHSSGTSVTVLELLREAIWLEEEDGQCGGKMCIHDPEGPAEADAEMDRQIHHEQFVAVTVRCLKTGYAVTAGLIAVGVITTTGPVAPLLCLGGAIIFLTYSVYEKTDQAGKRDFVETLSTHVTILNNVLDNLGRNIDLMKHLCASYAQAEKVATRTLAQIRDIKCQAKGVHAKHGVNTTDLVKHMVQYQATYKNIVDLVKTNEAGCTRLQTSTQALLTNVLNKMKIAIKLVAAKTEHLFSEDFERTMGIWDGALATAAVVTAGIDFSGVAETAAEMAEAPVASLAEIVTATLHASEVRELIPPAWKGIRDVVDKCREDNVVITDDCDMDDAVTAALGQTVRRPETRIAHVLPFVPQCHNNVPDLASSSSYHTAIEQPWHVEERSAEQTEPELSEELSEDLEFED